MFDDCNVCASLQALAVGVGPYHCAAGWEAASAALKAARSDVSRPVRDAAAGALPVLAALQEFLGAGAPPEQWPAVSGALLAGERGGRSRPRRPLNTARVGAYSCSPSARRPAPRMNTWGLLAAVVRVATVIATAAINTVCPTRLAARNV